MNTTAMLRGPGGVVKRAPAAGEAWFRPCVVPILRALADAP